MTTMISQLKFDDLPTDYAGLVAIYPPRPIHDGTDLENAIEVIDLLAGFEDRMTPDQTDYLEAVATFVDRFEDEHAQPDLASGLDLVKQIMADDGLSGADLARILQISTSATSRILSGERSITADHARTLGQHFRIDPGAFIRP